MEFIYDIEFALYIFQDTIIYHTTFYSQGGAHQITSITYINISNRVQAEIPREEQKLNNINFFMGSCDSGSVNNVGQRLTT